MDARTPPQNLEAEQSVLGSILLDNEVFAQIEGTLSAEHFYKESHRKLWRACERLFRRNRCGRLLCGKVERAFAARIVHADQGGSSPRLFERVRHHYGDCLMIMIHFRSGEHALDKADGAGTLLFGNSDLSILEPADPDRYSNQATSSFVDLTVEKVGDRLPGLADPAIAASTCSQTDRSRHTFAISAIGSTAPVLVAPATASTASGRRPARRSASMAATSPSTRIRRSRSTGRTLTCCGRNPRLRAARASEECPCSET